MIKFSPIESKDCSDINPENGHVRVSGYFATARPYWRGPNGLIKDVASRLQAKPEDRQVGPISVKDAPSISYLPNYKVFIPLPLFFSHPDGVLGNKGDEEGDTSLWRDSGLQHEFIGNAGVVRVSGKISSSGQNGRSSRSFGKDSVLSKLNRFLNREEKEPKEKGDLRNGQNVGSSVRLPMGPESVGLKIDPYSGEMMLNVHPWLEVFPLGNDIAEVKMHYYEVNYDGAVSSGVRSAALGEKLRVCSGKIVWFNGLTLSSRDTPAVYEVVPRNGNNKSRK